MFARLFGFAPPLWLYGIAVALALSGAFYSGWTVRSWKCEAAQAKALKQAQAAFQKQLDRQNDIARQYESERDAARAAGRERETRVREIYRDRVVPAECEPDPVAVGLLRDAIAGANSATSQSGEPVRGTP